MIRKQFFQRSLQQAREAVANIEEVHLRAEVLAVIASVSNDMADLKAADEIIADTGLGELRSETLVVIIKKLARLKKFRQAREMVHSIRATDNFWRAEAIARIALYSRQSRDFGEAKKYAARINNPSLMKDVLEDIKRFKSDPGSCLNHIGDEHIQEMINDLVSILKEINEGNLNRAHALASRKNSAYLRAHAFAVVAGILAESICE